MPDDPASEFRRQTRNSRFQDTRILSCTQIKTKAKTRQYAGLTPRGLDSFALLAFLRGEAGEEKVAALLERAGLRDEPLQMTEVNYAEVKYLVIRKDGPDRWEEVANELPALPLEFCPVTRPLADGAADFKARYRLSLANAFAAALAKAHKAELITGDPEFKALEKEIKIGWLTEYRKQVNLLL